jgi:phage terminase large subunit-like protein
MNIPEHAQNGSDRLTEPLRGITEPRLRTPDLGFPSKGQEFIDFCKRIDYPLLPWQEYLAMAMLQYKPDNRWAHQEVGVVVARQQGKSTFMSLLIIWKMYELGEKLQVATAHKLTTSAEIFFKIDQIIQSTPELLEGFFKKYESKGSQEIRLKNGNRYLVRANNSAARGIAAVDSIHMDEIREYESLEVWSSMRYTQMSSLNPQVIVYSNAGHQHSIVLNKLRDRAIACIGGVSDPIAWFEWSAPPDTPVNDSPEFWAGAAQSNPSLGYTVHPDNLRAVLNDEETIVRTEVLCQWVNVINPAIPPLAWSSCFNQDAKLDRNETTWMAMDISPDRKHGALLGAQQNGDKFTVMLLATFSNPVNIDDRQMANEIADWVRKYPTETVAYSRQTTGAVAARLAPAGISTTPIDGALYGQSCDEMLSAITSNRLLHSNQAELNQQVLSAVKLPYKDGGWYLGRKASSAPICATVAMAMVSHFATRPETELDVFSE